MIPGIPGIMITCDGMCISSKLTVPKKCFAGIVEINLWKQYFEGGREREGGTETLQ